MRRQSLPLIACLLAGTAIPCGCSDPYLRDGTWHATGVNQDNLRAMVADPADLQWGVSESGSDGQLAAAAVARLRSGTPKPLSGGSISKIGGGDSAAAATPSVAAGGTN